MRKFKIKRFNSLKKYLSILSNRANYKLSMESKKCRLQKAKSIKVIEGATVL